MKKLLIGLLLLAFVLPVFGQNQDEFKFSLVPRRVAVPSLTGYVTTNGLTPLTADWNVGAFTLTMGGLTVNSVATSEATLSATNLLTNGDFATNDLTGWTAAAGWSGATGKAVHTAGIADTTALVQAVAMTTGAIYQIQFTVVGRTAGTVTMTCGALPTNMSAISADAVCYWSVTAAATTNYNLTFTPTATFDGAIDDISVKLVTANATPLLAINNSAGTGIGNIRGNPTLKNLGMGVNALRFNTTGYENTLFGNNAGSKITTGFYNVGIGNDALSTTTASYRNTGVGYNALYSLTSGNANTAIGAYAMQSTTTGGNNTAIGYNTLLNCSGNYNAALGHYALYTNTSGIYNTGLGAFAGQYIANGITSNLTSDYCVYVGADTKALADNDQNETVIGYGATGAGSNTATLGSTANLRVVLNGSVENPTTAITAGSSTGLTVNSVGNGNRQVYKVTTTYLAYETTPNSLTQDLVIATLPAKTKLVGIYADTTIAYAGADTVTLMVGKAAAGVEYIAVHDVKTIAVVKGLADADLGTEMNHAGQIQGGALVNWTATIPVTVRITTATQHTDDLSAGSTTFYLVTERY
jgi:hypothetical protein